MEPGKDTTIHFDIHSNVRFFTNHEQLAEQIIAAVEGNRERLLEEPDAGGALDAALLTWAQARASLGA